MSIALNLPNRDQGIDLIARTKTGAFWAVQCKYRSSDEHSLTWREISTFTGLTFGICKGIEFGLIAYTGERYTKVLSDAEHISFLSSDTWSALSEEFFERLSKELQGEPQSLTPLTPRPHQQRAIANAKTYFADSKNTRGKLIMPCGAGKSLTGFWIAEALKAKTIVIAVPSLGLIQQTLPVWLREYAALGKHNKLRWLCVCSDQTVAANTDSIVVHTQDLGYPALTNKDDIKAWLEETEGASPRVIFTTCQSGKVLAEAMRESSVGADLGIMDEAHKTVGQKDKLFSHLLFDENLPMKRRVFMTATERRYAGQGDDIISMDDPEIYGETFELLSFKEGLEQDPPILSDYKIITMVIDHDEIAKLVAENRYVRPEGGAWSEEIEAQMLASMVALRKAMQKFPIKHAVSFHNSIRRADEFRELNDTYTSLHPQEGGLQGYHVTGATPAATRKKVIAEFAKSPRSLITNARCLTEGIDVPNIDCVLFADPKQSTIDIVQAVGRALRPVKGKEFGYVIVPVISRGERPEEFIESAAFAQVLTILRSLASNDERIIEEFNAINSGKIPKSRVVEIEIDERIATKIRVEDFQRKIETVVWSRLARLSWRRYEDAITFVRSLRLKNSYEWLTYCRGERPDLPTRPYDIPAKPHRVYGADFVLRGGMSSWLGAGRRTRGWRPYSDAKQFVNSLQLKTAKGWEEYCRGDRTDLPTKPADIPMRPEVVYRKEFESMGKWLGADIRSSHERPWRPYPEAVKFAHGLNLKNEKAWLQYTRGELAGYESVPVDIPKAPDGVYEEFKRSGGWGYWLGNANRRGGWRPYNEAKTFVHTLGLKTRTEWWAYCKGQMPQLPEKPLDIPTNAKDVYGDEYKLAGGMSAWLGTNRSWRTYPEAVKFVHSLGLKNKRQWIAYCKGLYQRLLPKPADIPNSPDNVYANEFAKTGWGGWLGTGRPKRVWPKTHALREAAQN